MGGRGSKSANGSKGRIFGGQNQEVELSNVGSVGENVRNRIMNANSVDDIRQALSDAGMSVVVGSSLEGLGVEATRVAMYGVASVLEEYKGIAGLAGAEGKNILVTCGTKKSSSRAEASYDGVIYLKKSSFSDLIKLEAACRREADASQFDGHFHPIGTTMFHVTAHETGHLVERALISKDLGGYSETISGGSSYGRGVIQWMKCSLATRVVGDACKKVKKTEYGKGKKNDELIRAVSGYAKTNRSEALAECISDYAANKDKANPLSIAVHDIIIEELG